MKIERPMFTSEYHNTYDFQSFYVLDELPKLNVVIDDDIDETFKKMYTDCTEFSSNEFCGEDKPYDEGYYKYYRLHYTSWYVNENGEREDESGDYFEYVAVFEKYRDEELDLTEQENRGRS